VNTGTRDTDVCKREGMSMILGLYRRNVKLCDLCRPPYITRKEKVLQKLRCAGRIASFVEENNAYRRLAGNPLGKLFHL
jgi:hypothetical protein